MMHTIRTILESRDFITAALQVAGLLTLAGFWLLYFVRYHRAERERRRLAEQLAAERAGTAARQTADKMPRPAKFTDAQYPWEHRA